MPIAAVPKYLGNDFRDAPPGLRFGMYLKLWGINRRTQALLWQTYDIDYEIRGQNREEREVKKENKVDALAGSTRLNPRDRAIMQALAARQTQCERAVPSALLLRLDALSIGPFTTGLGNEHPLENGFAFLNPYGLPYLPGSGVKGVLRQAARELASGQWGESHGWSDKPSYPLTFDGKPMLDSKNQPVVLSMLDVLFGRETPSGESDHVRGALTFWDVIPHIEGDNLMIEIMTPHQAHYYQQKRERKAGDSVSPHDSGQPTPISFLTVPPGSGFSFIVTCDLRHLKRLAPGLAEPGENGEPRWKELMTAAFEHAFEWLGFGAKTAVGYGAMRRDAAAEERAAKARAEREAEARRQQEAAEQEARRQAELARLDPVERAIREFLDGRPDKNQPEISAVIGAVKQGRWQGEEKVAVARWLEARMKEKKGEWKETSQAKKPEKDREYQNTLLVKSWLEGK